MKEFEQWQGFSGRKWKEGVDVRDFIQNNYKPYDGDESFLAGPTEATDKLWGKLQELQKEERKKRVQEAWKKLKTTSRDSKEFKEVLTTWNKLDTEYLKLYNEEY